MGFIITTNELAAAGHPGRTIFAECAISAVASEADSFQPKRTKDRENDDAQDQCSKCEQESVPGQSQRADATSDIGIAMVLAAEIGGVCIALELATGIGFQWWAIPIGLVVWLIIWMGTFGII